MEIEGGAGTGTGRPEYVCMIGGLEDEFVEGKCGRNEMLEMMCNEEVE